jgi:hypothetical protein
MRVNYILDKDNYVIGYLIKPFNENKPYIEVDNIDKIIPNKSKIIDGKVVNTFEGNQTYKYQIIHNLRVKRKPLLEAFDKYKTNVNYRIIVEDEETKGRIISWYSDLLNLVESAFEKDNIPSEIKYYL